MEVKERPQEHQVVAVVLVQLEETQQIMMVVMVELEQQMILQEVR